MKENELDNWFCSISVKQKEHIAAKLLLKDGKDVKDALYPNCWNIWKGIGPELKQKIHDHCTDSHGMWIVDTHAEGAMGHDF